MVLCCLPIIIEHEGETLVFKAVPRTFEGALCGTPKVLLRLNAATETLEIADGQITEAMLHPDLAAGPDEEGGGIKKRTLTFTHAQWAALGAVASGTLPFGGALPEGAVIHALSARVLTPFTSSAGTIENVEVIFKDEDGNISAIVNGIANDGSAESAGNPFSLGGFKDVWGGKTATLALTVSGGDFTPMQYDTLTAGSIRVTVFYEVASNE